MNSKERQTEIEKRLTERVADDLIAIDTETLYDDMLDECYDFSNVGGPFAYMSPARVLAEVDPVAYRCGKNDYEDAESRDNWEEVDGAYYDHREVEALRAEIEAEIDAETEEAEEDTDEA